MKTKPAHKPIRPKYNPRPNARELRHHRRLQELPCIACGGVGGVFHHLLTSCPDKRWRRDHELGLPMCNACHCALHADGNERRWCEREGFDPVREAVFLRNESIYEGIL